MEEFAFNIQVGIPEDQQAEFFAEADQTGVLPAVRSWIATDKAAIYLDPNLDPEKVMAGLRERV